MGSNWIARVDEQYIANIDRTSTERGRQNGERDI
jgi:hypothetical protein